MIRCWNVLPRNCASLASFRESSSFPPAGAHRERSDWRFSRSRRFAVRLHASLLRYRDVWDAVWVLKKILETEAWRLPEFQKRQLVT